MNQGVLRLLASRRPRRDVRDGSSSIAPFVHLQGAFVFFVEIIFGLRGLTGTVP